MQRVATDAVVVGGGAIGVACAHYLAEEGLRVTLVERSELGGGCSFANAGLICPGHSQALPGPGVLGEGLRALIRRDGPFTIRPRAGVGVVRWLLRFLRSSDAGTYRRSTAALVGLSRLSLELYRDLVDRGQVELDLRRGPLITAFVSEGWRRVAEAEQEELDHLGFSSRILGLDELLGLEPALGPANRGALVIEDQAWGDCLAYVRSLAAALRLRLPIQPATGYSSTMATWDGAPSLPVIVQEKRVVILPLGDRVRFAGTLELAGFRREPDPVRYRAVVRSGSQALRRPPPTEGEPWFGYRPLLPDDLPAIGWAPGLQGVLVATGHGTLGFTQSPATGMLIADLAAGRPPSIPMEPFRPGRF